MRLELRRVVCATPQARDARRTWPERERLLLRLSNARGDFGVGEASPLPGYSPDGIGPVEQALRALDLKVLERTIDRALPSDEAGAAWPVLRDVSEMLPERLPSARTGLESAALDWLGRRERRPAPQLLGAAADAAAVLAYLAGPADAPDLIERVAAARRAGYTHFKVKVGARERLRYEVAGVSSVRDALGPSARLRLDANRAWTGAQVGEAWPKLERAGIELFEEPGVVPASLLGQLPLALDESLQLLDPQAVARTVAERHAVAVVLKPTALGGLAHCFAVAQAARRAGADVIVSHCFEGCLAWRAAASLALALGGDRAQGLAPHAALGATVPVEAGALHSWSEHGLGEPEGFD